MFGKEINPTIHKDDRGEFCELFNADVESEVNMFGDPISQVSLSTNVRNVFRGMHFQYAYPMEKTMRVVSGAVDLIEMDMRPQSDTFGKFTVKYATAGPVLFYAPAYIARGFYTYEANTVVEYFHSTSFRPECSVTISYRELTGYNIDRAVMSVKDRFHGKLLTEWRKFAIENRIFIDR